MNLEKEGSTYKIKTSSGDVVYIGNREKEEFRPKIKLNRWSGECFLEVDFQECEEEELEEETDSEGNITKIKWKVKTIDFELELEYEPVEPKTVTENINGIEHKFLQNELGGLEFRIVLSKKPSINIFELPINVKDLKFYYQPPLTEEFKKEDCEVWTETYVKTKNVECFRPENVVGSYAVYHATRSNMHRSKEDAEKYKTGKAFHIYRPKAIDSAGNEAWCDLHIDEENRVLTITIPKEFLHKAVYPVTIDPTFGYETAGGSSTDFENIIRGSVFTIPEGGTAESITACIRAYELVETRKYSIYSKTAIYLHSDSSLVAQSSSTSTYKLDFAWMTWNLTTNPSLSANTEYVLVAWAKTGTRGGSTLAEIKYDTGDTDQGHYQELTYDGFPDPATFSHNNYKHSIYCTYTVETQEVYRTFSIIEDLKKQISIFFSLIHSVLVVTIVTKTIKLLFLLSSLSKKILTSKHSIKTFLINLIRSTYNLKKEMSELLISKYSTKELVSKLITSFSNILNNVANILTSSFLALIYKAREYKLIFSIKELIFRIVNMIHALKSNIPKLLISKYSIKQLKITIFNSVFNLLNLRSRTITFIYSLRNTLSISFRSIFSIIGRLSRSLKVSYAIGLFITRVLQISHSIIGQLFSSIKLLQNVLNSSINLFIQKYGVKGLREKIFTSISNLSGLILKEFQILYSIIFKQIISSTLRIFHNIRVLLYRSISSSFKIFYVLQRIISVFYKISGIVTKELISSFKNLIIKLRVVRLKFKLKSNIEALISTLYSSIGVVSNILKIGFELISGIYEILVTLIRIRPHISLIRNKTIVTLIKEKTIQILRKIIRRVKG